MSVIIYDLASMVGAHRSGRPCAMSCPQQPVRRDYLLRPLSIPLCPMVICTAVLLGGCGLSRVPTVHTVPVQQGNVIVQESLDKLKLGMTRSQVRFALGTPLIVDVFRDDRWDYVYFHQRRGEPTEQRRVTVVFAGDALLRIEGDVVAGSGTAKPLLPGSQGAAPIKTPASAAAGAAPKLPPPPPPPAEPVPERGFFGRIFQRIGL